MTDKTLKDYDKADMWDSGVESCPHCGMEFSGESGAHCTVYHQNGKQFNHLLETEPGTGPYFCPECYQELRTNKRIKNNKNIEEYL